jgi:hypothetical protein
VPAPGRPLPGSFLPFLVDMFPDALVVKTGPGKRENRLYTVTENDAE